MPVACNLRCSSRQVEFGDAIWGPSVIWICDEFLLPHPVQVNVVEFALDVIEELQDQPGGLQRLIEFQVSDQQTRGFKFYLRNYGLMKRSYIDAKKDTKPPGLDTKSEGNSLG